MDKQFARIERAPAMVLPSLVVVLLWPQAQQALAAVAAHNPFPSNVVARTRQGTLRTAWPDAYGRRRACTVPPLQ